MGLHQTKRFLHSKKKAINNIKRQPMEWENIIAATSDAGFTSKFYKERIKHTHTHTHTHTQKSNLKVQGKGCE